MNVVEVKALAERIRAETAKAVIGQADTVDLLLTALFSGGHVLLEGPPGAAKTFLAQCFARTVALDFGRIQFTPDLMPGDVVGANLFNFQTNAFTLIDSAFSGSKEAAYRILADSIDLQQASKQMGVILGFIGLLCSQLEIMVETAERRAEGQDLAFIAKETGINEYRLRKAASAAAKRTVPQLRADLDAAYQMEKDIKNGVMDARLCIELFIAGL